MTSCHMIVLPRVKKQIDHKNHVKKLKTIWFHETCLELISIITEIKNMSKTKRWNTKISCRF